MSSMIPCPGMQCGVFEHKSGSAPAQQCGKRTERTKSVAGTPPTVSCPMYSDEETREYIKSGSAEADLKLALSEAGISGDAPEGTAYAKSLAFRQEGFMAKLGVVGRPDLKGEVYVTYPYRLSQEEVDSGAFKDDADKDGFMSGWEQGEFGNVGLEGLIESADSEWGNLDVAGRCKVAHDHFVKNLQDISADDSNKLSVAR